ncbi:MAG: hypothetical protein MZV65_52875 [Chromatiales bacterium]|nr:hypothetical protein [Chromatiales bacterium]
MSNIDQHFEAYSGWRQGLFKAVGDFRGWPHGQELADVQIDQRLDQVLSTPARRQALCRVRGRILARQVGADQRHLLRRLRPAHPAVVGRAHHHVPDRADVRRVAAAVHPRCCRSRRARGWRSTPDLKRSSAEWRVFPVDVDSPDGMLQALQAWSPRRSEVPVDEARIVRPVRSRTTRTSRVRRSTTAWSRSRAGAMR